MTTSSTTGTSYTSPTYNGSSTSSSSNSGPLITAGQLNVSQLVSEMMVVESQPLTQLQSQEAGVQSTLSAYGQVQSAVSSLQSAAAALALPTAFQAASATVTGNGVSATVTGTPASANYAVTVSSLAQTQSIASTPVASATATLATGTLSIQMGAYDSTANTFTPTSGSNPISVVINSTDDTLSGIAGAINSAANGSVNASVVTNANGTSQLVISSANTGTANSFSVTASSGLSQFAFDPTATAGSPMQETQAAADAQFTVNGLALTSASNSVTTAINGVTLNLTQAPAAGATSLQAQVTVGTDPAAITSSVNSFISAYNSLITLTNNLTNYDASTNTASVLTGDPTTRDILDIMQSILGSQTSAAGTNPSYSWLAEVGVSVNSDGTLSLNQTQFQSALSANPTAVAAMFTGDTGTGAQQGFAVQISNAASQMIGPSGALGAAEAGLQSQITYMNTKQSLMQAQLAQIQASLTQEYSQVNSMLANASAEQTSLTNELSSLPG